MRDPGSRLRRRLTELIDRNERLEEHLRNAGYRSPEQLEDWMNVTELDEVVENLEAGTLARLRQVIAALGRLENGSYGRCIACGDPIEAERLVALPETPRCITCALDAEAAPVTA